VPKRPMNCIMRDKTAIDDLDNDALLKLLKQLKSEHRHIDEEVDALRDMGAVDMLKIGRMKKIKLRLKDRIARIEDLLTPDIIA